MLNRLTALSNNDILFLQTLTNPLMPNLDTLTRSELYKEIADLARDEGITSQDDWNELADEVIESHLDLGELDPDQDVEGLRAALHASWDTYQSESAPESDSAVDEDPEAPHAEQVDR